MKRWWLDELACAGPEHLDEAYEHAGFEIVESEYFRSAYGRYLCRRVR
jgi:hypothetical protein